MLYLGDDIGMQRTPMMSLELYCKWLKPRLAAVIRAARDVNPDILIFYHSCGFVTPFLPHLIEAGVDVLNPVQPESMDFGAICREYGGKISFHGTIGTQTTMPFGTPQQVRETVWKHLQIAKPFGGLLPAAGRLLRLGRDLGLVEGLEDLSAPVKGPGHPAAGGALAGPRQSALLQLAQLYCLSDHTL